MLGIDIGADEKMISKDENRSWDFGKLIVLAIFSVYFLNIAFCYTDNWSFIDNVNIWVHEAGHFIFMFFGNDFLYIAGGTIMQLLMPAIFIGYFYHTNQKFSAALTFFWLGENFISVSVYMADAVDMVLPLIGGGGTEGHDWHNMFTILGILPYTEILAGATRTLGVFIMFFAIGWGIKYSRKTKMAPEMIINGRKYGNF
ncbi:MAG: hypothetical protein WC178_05480 [Candidatus Paceibacterota bacterium]